MSRLIDADALVADMTNRYCMDCVKRKGMRNGKLKLVYAIGEAPCRACGVGDAIDDIESAPTIDAVPVVRCKDCAHCEIWKHPITNNVMYFCTPTKPHITDPDGYCEKGEKRNAETD